MNLIADNYKEALSSCYFLDLRNSTHITREISLSTDGKSRKNSNRLERHAQFLMGINEHVNQCLERLDHKLFYYNDTGDGHLCLFWDKTHTWTALKIVCSLARFLTSELKNYHFNELKTWSKEIGHELDLNFGIGLHTGGSLVYNNEKMGRDFVFGIVLNTASRVESYTKQFTELSLLFTHNFYLYLDKQIAYKSKKEKQHFKRLLKNIKPVTSYKVDIKDSKSRGHLLYTIDPDKWELL
jgi:class 3 adenylate cyclase